MFQRIEDFVKLWKGESEGTLKIMRTLTDPSLTHAGSADGRNLGRLAWHITRSIPEMMGEMGVKVAGVDLEAPVPTSAAQIVETYQRVSTALLNLISKEWTDETLQIVDKMYGEDWKRGFTLQALVNHEIHHRGQMTILMRQAGLKVPGVYGPSLEEWAGYGMKPPAI
jgi:uncharacterized damage-inducible protein DinB